IEQARIRNLTLELFEAFAFEFDKGIQVHQGVVAAVSAAEPGAWHKRLYNELSFLLGAGSFRAAVTAGKFLDAARRIDKLLFTGEKGMTRGTNADLNIATRGAGGVHRGACAHHISRVIFWVNTCFQLITGARNGLPPSR